MGIFRRIKFKLKSKKLAITFKEKGSVIFLVPSSKGGNVNLFNQCVAVADIVKFADQIIKDISQFDSIGDKLFVQTKGERGISFRYNSEWMHLAPVMNDNVDDTAGVGD